MIFNKKIEAIFIDLDGTLIDSHEQLFRAYAKFLLLQGKVATEEEFVSLNGVPIFDILPILKKNHDLHLPIEELQWILKSFVEEEYLESPLMRGAQDFLDWARSVAIPLGIVTSSREEWVLAILKNLDISSYFTSIVCRERVARGKPFPDPYLLGIKDLRVNPGRSYAIDDADFGIQSAKEAGLKVIKYVPAPPYPPEGGGDWLTLKVRLSNLFAGRQ